MAVSIISSTTAASALSPEPTAFSFLIKTTTLCGFSEAKGRGLSSAPAKTGALFPYRAIPKVPMAAPLMKSRRVRE
jgi:hypothetical protein